MDERLQHLAEMKRKLIQLREQRPIVTGNISSPSQVDNGYFNTKSENGGFNHLLNGPCKASKNLVDVGMQTDGIVDDEEQAELSIKDGGARSEIITYEKAIQTEVLVVSESDTDSSSTLDDASEIISKGEHDVISEVEVIPGSEYSDRDKDNTKLKPLVISSQNISLETTTFALLEALENKKSLIGAQQMEGNESYVYSHELDLDTAHNMDPLCVGIDYYQGFILVLVQLESRIQFYNIQTVCYVVNFETGEIIDSVNFQGQTIIKGEFIKIKNSKIVSIFLSSYNGKTVLYELRAVASRLAAKNSIKPKLERNVISRNYHNWPVFAMWQHHVRESKILTASTDGTIHELNLIDLKPVEDPTSWNAVKVVSLSRSELILKEQYGNSKFIQQLSKLSMYDEVTIKAICTFYNDPSSIYIGCEDGGIYKIVIEKGEGKRSVKIAMDNNGFIPDTQVGPDSSFSFSQKGEVIDLDDDLEKNPLFHVGPITALFSCNELPGLMVSCSMDWKCNLWDVANNNKLCTIDLDNAVISGEWATFSGERGAQYLALLTAIEFHLYEIDLSSHHSHLGNIKWSLVASPKRVISIPVTETKHNFKMFCSFKLVQRENWYVVFGGDNNKLECYKIFS